VNGGGQGETLSGCTASPSNGIYSFPGSWGNCAGETEKFDVMPPTSTGAAAKTDVAWPRGAVRFPGDILTLRYESHSRDVTDKLGNWPTRMTNPRSRGPSRGDRKLIARKRLFTRSALEV